MKHIKKLLITAMALMVAQSSMAYTGQVRLNGFSSEAEAISGAKVAIQEMRQDSKYLSAGDAGHCSVFSMADTEVRDVRISKYLKVDGDHFQPAYEALIRYDYDCGWILTP